MVDRKAVIAGVGGWGGRIDMAPTPAACRQIARLFRARQAQLEEVGRQVEQSLDGIGKRTNRELAPWGRELLTAAFEALRAVEEERVWHMRDALDALEPYAEEERDDVAYVRD